LESLTDVMRLLPLLKNVRVPTLPQSQSVVGLSGGLDGDNVNTRRLF